jgi:DNA-binding transcriptional LysR family regulator
LVEEKMADQGITMDQLKVAMVVGNAEAIEVAVEHGLGVAFISLLAARHGLKSGCIVEVPIEGLHLQRPLYVVRNHCCAKTTAEIRLWDFIEQYRGEIAYTLDIRDPQEGFERSTTVASP